MIAGILIQMVAGMTGNIIYIMSAEEKIPPIRLFQIILIACIISPIVYAVAFKYTQDQTYSYGATILAGWCGPPLLRFLSTTLQRMSIDPLHTWKSIIELIKFWKQK